MTGQLIDAGTAAGLAPRDATRIVHRAITNGIEPAGGPAGFSPATFAFPVRDPRARPVSHSDHLTSPPFTLLAG